MLKDQQVGAVLPAQDIARARAYYSEKLGLEPENPDDDDNLQYRCGDGTGFFVYQTSNAGTAKNTQMAGRSAMSGPQCRSCAARESSSKTTTSRA